MNRRSSSRESLLWLVGLLFGVTFTVVSFLVLKTQEENAVTNAFQSRAIERVARLQANIDRALDDLVALGGFMDAFQTVDRQQFQRMSTILLKKNTPIQALEWIPVVPAKARNQWVLKARREGFEKFDFTQRQTQGQMVSASPRAVYFPVYFVEPLRGNENALGFDLGSNPERRHALEMAEETASMVATARVSLVQEKEHQFGFLVFRPLFDVSSPVARANPERTLQGFVLGVFRVGDLVQGTRTEDDHQLHLMVFDADAHPGEGLLYPVGAKVDRASQVSAPMRWSHRVTVAERSWDVIAIPAAGFFEASYAMSFIVLALGLLLSVVWALYLWQKGNSLWLTEEIVEERTRDLERERRFGSAVFEALGNVGMVLNLKGEIIRFNRAAMEFTGYAFEEVRSQPFFWRRFLEPQQRDRAESLMLKMVESPEDFRKVESVWVNRSGQAHQFEWSATLITDAEENRRHLVLVGTDVSERNQTAQHLSALLEEKQAILQSQVVGVAMVRHRQFIWTNSTFARMLGYSPEELTDRSCRLIYRTDEQFVESGRMAYPLIQNGQVFRTQGQYLKRNGDLGWYDVSGARLNDEDTIWAFVDIT
jgi:PAS domain S-box-containing protein